MNYKSMFNAIKGHNFFSDLGVHEHISWAKATLKRSDWKVYYLRIVRYVILKKQLGSMTEEQQQIASDFLNKQQRFETLANLEVTFPRAFVDLGALQEKMKHFIDMDLPLINNMPIADMCFERFSAQCEKVIKEYQAQQLRKTPEAGVRFMECGEYVWFNLLASGSREEGRAMRHCGNGVGSDGDVVYSLRSKVAEGVWVPHVTLILTGCDTLDSPGFTTEIKGYGNQKPSSEYHDAIVAFILSDRVLGLNDGGYLPERNFRLTDLTEPMLAVIEQQKPELIPFMYFWEKHGDCAQTRSVFDKAIDQFSVTRNHEQILALRPDVQDKPLYMLGTIKLCDIAEYENVLNGNVIKCFTDVLQDRNSRNEPRIAQFRFALMSALYELVGGRDSSYCFLLSGASIVVLCDADKYYEELMSFTQHLMCDMDEPDMWKRRYSYHKDTLDKVVNSIGLKFQSRQLRNSEQCNDVDLGQVVAAYTDVLDIEGMLMYVNVTKNIEPLKVTIMALRQEYLQSLTNGFIDFSKLVEYPAIAALDGSCSEEYKENVAKLINETFSRFGMTLSIDYDELQVTFEKEGLIDFIFQHTHYLKFDSLNYRNFSMVLDAVLSLAFTYVDKQKITDYLISVSDSFILEAVVQLYSGNIPSALLYKRVGEFQWPVVVTSDVGPITPSLQVFKGDLEDFARTFDLDGLQSYREFLTGEDSYGDDWDDASDLSVAEEYLVEYLAKEQDEYQQIVGIVKSSMPVSELVDVNFDEIQEVIDCVNDSSEFTGSDFKQIARHASIDAERCGAEGELWDSFVELQSNIGSFFDGHCSYDGENVILNIPVERVLDELVKQTSEQHYSSLGEDCYNTISHLEDDFLSNLECDVDLEVPYYGFSGFDESVLRDSISNAVYDFIQENKIELAA